MVKFGTKGAKKEASVRVLVANNFSQRLKLLTTPKFTRSVGGFGLKLGLKPPTERDKVGVLTTPAVIEYF